jgi:hypothetical protein
MNARLHKDVSQINRKCGTKHSDASLKRQSFPLESISFMTAINPRYERGTKASLHGKNLLKLKMFFNKTGPDACISLSTATSYEYGNCFISIC